MKTLYQKLCSFKLGSILSDFPIVSVVSHLKYSSFHTLLVKINYRQLENLKRIERKIEKRSINPIIGFDQDVK